MKITCPHCKTVYKIDDSKVPEKGLLVKCSVCQTKYRVKKDPAHKDEEEQPAELEQKVQNGSQGTAEPQEAPKQNDGSDLFKDTEATPDTSNGDDLFASNATFTTGLDEPEAPASNTGDGFTAEKAKSSLDSILNTKSDDAEDPLFGNDENLSLDDIINNADGLGKADTHEKIDIQTSSDEISNANEFSDSNLEGGLNVKKAPGEFSLEDNKAGGASDGDDLFDSGKSQNDDPFADPFAPDGNKDLFEGESDDLFGGTGSTPKPQSDIKDEFLEDLFGEDGKGPAKAADDLSVDKSDLISDDLFEEGTAIVQDDFVISEEKDEHEVTSTTVEHTFVPEDMREVSENPVQKKITPTTGGANPMVAKIVIGVASVAIIALLAVGGYWFFGKSRMHEQTDILENINESFAQNTGTLADVRAALDQDMPDSYMNSINVLKQYLRPEDSAPSAVGLDGQIKLNLLISYNKRIESSSDIAVKTDIALKKDPKNIDLNKAKALYLYEQKDYDKAAEILQPFTDRNDPEIFYILGLLAQGKNDLKNAESFFNKGLTVQENKQSTKIMYALANIKYDNGDAQAALAFLNTIISATPNYIKAYLLKAKILMNSDAKIEEANTFLKSVDPNIIARSEDFLKIDYYKMLAQLAQKRNEHDEAIKNYEKALEINRNDVETITIVADFYVQEHNASKAQEYYDKALAIDPRYPRAIVGKTEIYVLLEQSDKIYLELAKLDIPSIKNPELLTRIARIYYNVEDKVMAMKLNDAAIKADPSYIEPYIANSVILLDLNRIDEIKPIAKTLEKLNQNNYSYFMVMGILEHAEANYKQAAQYFKSAVQKNTDGDERVWYYYGRFLIDSQKYIEASEMFARAHRSDPKRYEYLQAYAESLEKEKKWNSVITLLESRDYNEKRMYKSLVSLANATFHLKRFDEAIKYVNKALLYNNQNYTVYYLKARILYQQKKYEEAAEEVNRAVTLDMNNFDNYMLYARILSKQGDFKGAMEKIEAAEKIEPSNQSLLLVKGIIHKNLDDYREALNYFKKITSKNLLREAYFEIGESFLQLDKRNDALKYLLLADKNGNKEAAFRIGDIYYEKGQLDKALAFFKKTVRNDKTNLEALKKIGYIYKEREEAAKALPYFNAYIKKVDDPYEKRMVEDEVYHIKQSMPQGRQMKNVTVEELEGNDPDAQEERAKDLYNEAKVLKDEDPKAAVDRLNEIMKILPKTNEYYKKAFKLFNEINAKMKSSEAPQPAPAEANPGTPAEKADK